MFLPINHAAAAAHLALALLLLYALKRALQPLPASNKPPPDCTAARLLLAFFRKYWLGGCFCGKERRYLVKELLLVSCYSAASLRINAPPLWPAALSALLVPVFLAFEVPK